MILNSSAIRITFTSKLVAPLPQSLARVSKDGFKKANAIGSFWQLISTGWRLLWFSDYSEILLGGMKLD